MAKKLKKKVAKKVIKKTVKKKIKKLAKKKTKKVKKKSKALAIIDHEGDTSEAIEPEVVQDWDGRDQFVSPSIDKEVEELFERDKRRLRKLFPI